MILWLRRFKALFRPEVYLIVSAESGIRKDRYQISAPIQKGNSGGPIVDICGNIIGLVASKFIPNGENFAENVNFVTRSWELLNICSRLGIELNTKELEEQVSSIALAKMMQNICVEIECWN